MGEGEELSELPELLLTPLLHFFALPECLSVMQLTVNSYQLPVASYQLPVTVLRV